MILIDATNSIVGRIATFAAKKALLGEEIAIVNCDKAVITGSPERVLADWKEKFSRGTPSHGPFYHRQPDRMLRRIIRGMLPYKKPRGAAAFKRIKCYRSVPEEFSGKELLKVPGSDVSKTGNLKYISLENLSKLL